MPDYSTSHIKTKLLEDKVALSMCLDGSLIKDIAKRLGVKDTPALRYWCGEFGYKPLSKRVNYVAVDSDCELSSYLLGYVLGDGCLLKDGRVVITSNDYDHLMHISSVLTGGTLKVHVQNKVTTRNPNVTYNIVISSKDWRKFFESHGLVPNKTNSSVKVEYSTGVILSHFVRGLFDSDGTVCKKGKIKVFSLYGQASYMNPLYGDMPLEVRYREWKTKSGIQMGTILSTRFEQLEKIYKWIYEGATLYMNRKKLVFDSIFNS